MKKKKPKVSYRELLADTTAPGVPGPTPVPAATPPVDAREAPPADRSRFNTPRQLAAVLNPSVRTPSSGMPAIPAEPAPPPAAAPPPPEPVGEAPPPMRPSQVMIDAVASDTMEFAVEAATAALPFRDRVKGRSGTLDIFTFRVGSEFFGTSLASVDEVLEIDGVTHVPEMRDNMLGVFSLRDRLVPVYTPARALGVALAAPPSAVLVLHADERLMGIAVDDVHDVVLLDLATVRSAPGLDDADGVLLGVARHGRDLIAILDAEALVQVCLSDPAVESA